MTDDSRSKYKGLRRCLAACLGLAVTGCTVPVSDLDLSKETIEHLPKEVALSFLMSLIRPNAAALRMRLPTGRGHRVV